MNPSPRAIEQAIEALKASPGTFQRLVEEYARIAHPLWFGRLNPGGRRSDDVTRKGWPDATAELPDGTVALLEATHSESWERHLAEDVQNAEELGHGAIGAFLFAAWAKTPDPEKLNAYRQRLLALGIPRAGILFLFRDHLASELSRPLFGRLWVDPLRLPASCLPFDVIDRVPRLFGPEERADLFAPRRSEYKDGLVYRPRLADTVEERLAHSGWALVRGRGAAGKTTLAVCIALGPAYAGRPVYYLDLTELEGNESEQGAAIETMATRGDRGVLFIVDNVHLASEAASRIFAGWQELAGNGSRLLLLGRLVTSEPDIRGRADPLEDLDREALELAIDADTLMGVYRRIVTRFSGFRRAEDPPPSVAERWLRTFGGDLIAFSTAVAQRFRDRQRGDWELAPGDVQRYIESEYLNILNQAERERVASLAAFATLELAIPAAATGSGFKPKVMEKGWIIRSEHGSSRQVRYQLVHPGLGGLVLTALGQEGSLAIFRRIAAENSFAGMMIARRLRIQNRHPEVRVILSAIAESSSWYSLSFGAMQLSSTVKMFEQYEALTAAEIDLRVSSEEYKNITVENALRTPLGDLGAFLIFAKANLPSVYNLLGEALAAEENQKVLTATALMAPLAGLVSFLSFAQSNLPDAYNSLAQALSAEENQKVLNATVLKAPLHSLPSFLIFAQGNLPGLYKSLVQALSAEGNQKVLGEAALRIRLAELGSFLSFAQGNLPGAHDSLVQGLSAEENRKLLTDTTLRTPLSELGSFLSFAQGSLPGVHNSLVQILSEEENQKLLTDTALRTPLSELGSFLSFAQGNLPGAYNSLVQALSAEENQKLLTDTALRTPLSELGSFLGFAQGNLPGAYNSLVQVLSAEENQKLLTDTALRTPLSKLGSFLSFAQGNLPGAYNSLVQTLSVEENHQVLADTALKTPLNELGSFLSFAKDHLREIYGSVTQLLSEEESVKVLIRTTLSSPVNHLVAFLAVTRGSLEEVHTALCQGLSDIYNRHLLANKVTHSSIAVLAAFLRQEDLAPTIVEAIDLASWQEWHLRNPGKGVESLPAVGRQLAKLGRPELATAPARGAIVAAELLEWHRSGAQLTTLSHTVRLAGDIDPGVLDRFLSRIATPDWLKSRFLWQEPGPLAGALFSLWYLLDSGRFKRFRTPPLLAVIERKIDPRAVGESVSFADLVSLVGVGGLVGLRRSMKGLAWQSDLWLHSAIAERLPSEQGAVLGPLQVQLWLGLRQLATHRKVPLRLKKEDGLRILQLWREAAPEHEKLKRLNSWMLAWLERCSDAGWRLLRDDTTFE